MASRQGAPTRAIPCNGGVRIVIQPSRGFRAGSAVRTDSRSQVRQHSFERKPTYLPIWHAQDNACAAAPGGRLIASRKGLLSDLCLVADHDFPGVRLIIETRSSDSRMTTAMQGG